MEARVQTNFNHYAGPTSCFFALEVRNIFWVYCHSHSLTPIRRSVALVGHALSRVPTHTGSEEKKKKK
jgi:hypothetical protein